MDELDLTPRDDDVSVEVSLERIEDELCKQGILGEDVDKPEYFYLAAIALGTRDDSDYDINRTLMEFIRNSSELEHVTPEAADEIENLLR